MRVLIAGAGDLGLATAQRLAAAGDEVFAIRRTPRSATDSIHWINADLAHVSAEHLPSAVDVAIFCATPDSRTEDAYRRIYIKGLAALINALANNSTGIWQGRLMLVTSTAVYAQDAGEQVDEKSATQPERFNGRVLLEAENLLAGVCAQPVAVRAGGIYGPGRTQLVRSVKRGGLSVQSEPPQYTNRIHRDDLADCLVHLSGLKSPHPVYCAVDSQPAPRHEVLCWLAEQLGAAPPVLTQGDQGQRKRVCNQRLLNSGFSLQYPDYKAGYRDLCRQALLSAGDC